MTVATNETKGLTALVQEHEALWIQWEEKINEESDAIASSIRDKVFGIIGNYFEKQCTTPVIALPTKNNPHEINVECSFKSPMTSIFWQCIPVGSDSEQSVLMNIRNAIPGASGPKMDSLLKESVVMEEAQLHEIKPKIDYTRLDTLLTGIAKKASELLNDALVSYAQIEGNSIFQHDVRVQTGCVSTSSFSKSSYIGKQAVTTRFWVDESHRPVDSEGAKKTYLSGGLFSFLATGSKGD